MKVDAGCGTKLLLEFWQGEDNDVVPHAYRVHQSKSTSNVLLVPNLLQLFKVILRLVTLVN